MNYSIYLAARYSRRLEICDYGADLRDRGHRITSRWLNGDHQISDNGTPVGDDGESLVEFGLSDRAAQLRQHFAIEDLQDVNDAQILITFTEPPRSTASRGGRHVELGYAIAQDKQIIVVGPRENVFCWLPHIDAFETWPEALAFVDAQVAEEEALWKDPNYVPF